MNFYPVKRPYPNPLYADADTDFDGDGLTQRDEYYAWVRYGGSKADLNYSDGCQDTPQRAAAAARPRRFPAASRGSTSIATASSPTTRRTSTPTGWATGTRPTAGMVYEYWTAVYELEKPYRPQYGAVDFLDPDTDGDGLPDGSDDQDYDDVNNISELDRGPYWVQPFNPCLPNWKSRTCSRHPPIKEPWPPFGNGFDPTEPLPLVVAASHRAGQLIPGLRAVRSGRGR